MLLPITGGEHASSMMLMELMEAIDNEAQRHAALQAWMGSLPSILQCASAAMDTARLSKACDCCYRAATLLYTAAALSEVCIVRPPIFKPAAAVSCFPPCVAVSVSLQHSMHAAACALGLGVSQHWQVVMVLCLTSAFLLVFSSSRMRFVGCTHCAPTSRIS